MMETNPGQTQAEKRVTLLKRNPSQSGNVHHRRNGQARDIGHIRLELVLVLLAILLLGTPIFAAMMSHSVPGPDYETVVVSQGDTLWTIAKRVKPRTDPRKTVYQIRQLNELDSVDLRPGQTLLIPL